MRAIIKENGNLRILADNQDRADLAYTNDNPEGIVAEGLHESFEFVLPEDVGALTDSPLLVESDSIDYTENGDLILRRDSKIWFFNWYAITDPWKQLRTLGYVEFQGA